MAFSYPTSVALEAGLGGRFDDVLIDELNVVGAWALGQVQLTTSPDLTGNGHDAIYSGSGFTRGVTVRLPDGSWAASFNGSSYLLIADDSGIAATLNLSLADGSMDIVVMFKTTTNDATRRALAQKQVTNATGNGWHVAILSGKLRFYLKVAGTVLFDLASATTVSDGNWHVAHCYYDPPTQDARIFLDGTQDASTSTATATDPAVTAADMRIGMFNDGSGGFIGTIAKVMAGREGNLTLAAELEATRVWTDLWTDVRMSVMPVTASYGIPGVGVSDTVATTGTLTFALDNSEANNAGLRGRYSVGHTNCLSGFEVNMPVRLRVAFGGVTYTKFRGSMEAAPPIAGEFRERYVAVICHDWMDTAAVSSSARLPVQVGKTADQVVGAVLDAARRPPAALTLNPSVVTFPYAIDSGRGSREKVLGEFARIAQSAGGAYLYIKGDTDEGGHFTFEPREFRQIGTSLAGTFSALRDLQVGYSKDRIINVVNVTYYPRRLDPSTTQTLAVVVGADTATIPSIPPGETITFTAEYKDPAQKSAQIGGTSMVSAATTDYTFNTASNGSGTNLTSSLAVTVSFWANAVEWKVTNSTGFLAYVTSMKARGQAIYQDEPVTLRVPDEASIRKHDEKPIDIDMKYEGSASAALEFARVILAVYSTLPEVVPASATIIGNKSSTLMTHALAREVGDRIGLEDTLSAVTTTDGWYINHVDFQLSDGGVSGPLVTTTWAVAPSWPEALIVSYSGAASGLYNLTFGGDLELVAGGDYTFIYNRTGDDIEVEGVAGGGGGGHGNADSTHNPGGAGGGGGACNTVGITVTIATTTYTGKVGAGGVGGRPGATGGTTEFRVPAGTIHLQLPGGVGGTDPTGLDTGGTGGAGGAAGTGTGNVAGTAGGNGGDTGAVGTGGTNNASGAAGGGGGGSSGQDGRYGGNGVDQNGGTSAAAGNAGNDASGLGGSLGSGSPGGSGSGGGGVQKANAYRGGGGGGGAGATSSNGQGGRGGHGCLVMRKV